jgi:hypothetical protein
VLVLWCNAAAAVGFPQRAGKTGTKIADEAKLSQVSSTPKN